MVLSMENHAKIHTVVMDMEAVVIETEEVKAL